jgi:tetratricopeptide (TPR) repeat protein
VGSGRSDLPKRIGAHLGAAVGAIGIWILAAGSAMAQLRDCASNQVSPQAVISDCSDLLSKDLPSKLRSVVYTLRAQAYLRNNETAKARLDLEQALTLDASNADAHVFRGRIFASKGEYQRANSEIDRALALSPNSPIAFEARADLEADRKRYPRAARAYEQAARLEDARESEAAQRADGNLGKYAEAMRQKAQEMQDQQTFQRHWADYLLSLQKQNHWRPNWSEPPYNLYVRNHPEFLENNPDAEVPVASLSRHAVGAPTSKLSAAGHAGEQLALPPTAPLAYAALALLAIVIATDAWLTARTRQC